MNNPQQPYKRPHRADFEQAMTSMDTFIDITVDDLMTLSQRAEQIANRRATESLGITQVMSKPVRTVHQQTPLSEVAHIMVTERISGVPVVDAAEHLVGIVTEADFLRALGVPDQHPNQNLWQTLESLFSHLSHRGELSVPNEPVAQHMVHNVVCVPSSQDLHYVIDVMKRHLVTRVIVCDDERRVLGIVTRSDLVRVFFDRFATAKSDPAASRGNP